MKNKFIKKINLIVITSFVFLLAVGCTTGNVKYTKEENELIEFANAQISSIYNVTINKDDYNYSVGKQVGDNEWGSLIANHSTDVVSVSGHKLSQPQKGDVVEFTFTYDVNKKEVINTNLDKVE